MMSAQAKQRVNQYWASQLSIPPDLLASQEIVLMPHAEPPNSYCFIFQHGAFTCVRLPAHYNYLHEVITSANHAHLIRPEWWQNTFATLPHRAIGPAYLGYADAVTFQPTLRHSVRILTPADSAVLAVFAEAIGPLAWEHSGLGAEEQPIAGCWEDDFLVAAAGYTLWGGALAHIGVTTHPAVRGRGYGRSVVSAIGQHALAQGYILQYRTLLSNSSSLALAKAVGMQAYGTTLFIRFTLSSTS
jgi:GNAT superfamily N-acetyltransferase